MKLWAEDYVMEQLLLELSPEIQKWLDAKSDDRNIQLSIALQDWIDFWVQNQNPLR